MGADLLLFTEMMHYIMIAHGTDAVLLKHVSEFMSAEGAPK
jgi:hypothetical protein